MSSYRPTSSNASQFQPAITADDQALMPELEQQRADAENLEKILSAELEDMDRVEQAAREIMAEAPGLLSQIIQNVHKTHQRWQQLGQALGGAAGLAAGGYGGHKATRHLKNKNKKPKPMKLLKDGSTV